MHNHDDDDDDDDESFHDDDYDDDPWKLKPGFINRVLVEVIFEASKCH